MNTIVSQQSEVSFMKLKLKRIEQGYKQYVFAEKVGITREYLRKLENGTAKNPSIELMKKISTELNTPVTELFFQD